jgi:hypothetical protein
MRRILAVVVVVVVLLVVFWRRPASIPEEFTPLVSDLRGRERLEVVVGWPQPRPPDREVVITVETDDTARVETSGAALVYRGAVKLEVDGFSVPLPDLTPRAEELLEEVRGGLSHSTWRTIDPPALGLIRPAPDAAWASVKLPFDWADGVEVLLAVDRDDGRLRYIMLSGYSAPFTVSTRPIQGGLRTVTLSQDAFVRLPVRRYAVTSEEKSERKSEDKSERTPDTGAP